MAEALKLGVIAEGVETIQQAGYFADTAQAVIGQGWLFGRPMPAAEFNRLMADVEMEPPVPAKQKKALASVA